MLWTKEKLKARTQELGGRRYFGFTSLTPFVSMEGQLSVDESNVHLPEKIEGQPYNVGDFFIGRDRYLWLEKIVQLPETKEGCEIAALFQFGDTGFGNNSGFEAMLYLNGQPYQGVDTNHQEVFLNDYAGQEVRISILLWTGLEGIYPKKPFYHQCKEADVAYLHKKTDELYYYAAAITETLDYLAPASEYYDSLMAALDRAFLVVDWDGDRFYETTEEAHHILLEELGKLEKHTEVTVHGVGHTHIDVAWLWRLKHTREKAQRSFSTVLRMMERYPEFIFQQAQPQLYQFIKEDSPELYTQIKERVKEGRWEADGGMWVEADCNLSSGEALVRQLLHGTRFFEHEFGKKCEYLWLPDVFGYSWALPQILKGCELDTFMTTKISWNQYNTIPDDLFWWKGIDGTEILTYFIDTPEVGFDFNNRYSTYNGLMSPRTVIGSREKFKNKELSKDTLISYGYGDGGGGVNRDMLEMRRVMDKLPGLPKVKPERAGDFFRLMHKKVEQTDRYVHTWDGELYLEYHRGTYTTQGYNKKMNRYLEGKLVQTEWLASLALVQNRAQGMPASGYDAKALHDAWECVLLHQFHDIIPGSSMGEVYQDSHRNYEHAIEQMEQAKETAFRSILEKEENCYSIYSTSSFGGEELVWLPVEEKGYFTDESGSALMSQKSTIEQDKGYYVAVRTKPYAVTKLVFHPGDETVIREAFTLDDGMLETPYYRIHMNEEGNLTEIYDKENGRQVLREGGLGNVLTIYEDKPLGNDAWDIDIFYYEKGKKATLVDSPELVENGPLQAVIRFRYLYHQSDITLDMVVYRHTRRIDFRTHVNWKETHKLLKVAFETDIRTTKATYDIQFGHVERPTHWNNSWDWAKFEVCGHKWADISENDYGVSLLNDCKYGYSVKDGVISLSLLRSPKSPDDTADMGEHTFIYALYPHKDVVTEGGTIEEALRLNLPAQMVAGAFTTEKQIVKVGSDRIQIDAVKKAEDEDAIVVRLHECRGGRGRVTLSSDYPVKTIQPCNLLENNTGEAVKSGSVEIELRPFKIYSYKLYF